MSENQLYDALIIGGSYAGLSAAMALGRSVRKVLIIDSGKPCNRQTPHSHNFITHDGSTPAQITALAKQQVLQYPTVHFHLGLATQVTKNEGSFEVSTEAGKVFTAKKILFATGLADVMPDIPGFAECWGISVLHCPYCHGYEVRDTRIGLVGNGDMGFELTRLLHNWSKNLVLFTNGKSTLTEEQSSKLSSYNIPVLEAPIAEIAHENGQLKHVVLADGSRHKVQAIFARPALKQHCDLLEKLGCAIAENGLVQVDEFQRTTVPGVYAAGDNTTMFRTVSMAVAAGTKAGAVINKELIDEEF